MLKQWRSQFIWFSRNMILSGSVILAFFRIAFYDFWVPEMVYKYVEVNPLILQDTFS
jgi:hypothetical protein